MPEYARRGTCFQDLVGGLQSAAPNVAARLKALQGEGTRLYQRHPRSALLIRSGKTLGPMPRALHGSDGAQRNRREPASGEGQ